MKIFTKNKYTFLVLFLIAFSTAIFSQAPQYVLMENFTSSTCGPCGSNNPQLLAWQNQNWNNGLVMVAYHMNWPSPGNDPMYAFNSSQLLQRRTYYNVNSIPYGILMGSWTYIGSPFTYSNMTAHFNVYRGQTSPLSVNVVDTRTPANDSNVAVVTVTNLSNLPTGNYTLKVQAIENLISNISPPPTNGESTFPNVFRMAFPSVAGTPISATAGTYTFTFRYKIDPAWVNSQIYTMAFVQNDADHSIMNTHRFGMTLTGIQPYSNEVPAAFSLSQNYPNPFNPTTNIKFNLPKSGQVSLKLYDVLGHEVKTLVEGVQQAGVYNISVDGTNLSSGIYFYTLRTGNFVETKKMSLIK